MSWEEQQGMSSTLPWQAVALAASGACLADATGLLRFGA
jgi:hypothetical protein